MVRDASSSASAQETMANDVPARGPAADSFVGTSNGFRDSGLGILKWNPGLGLSTQQAVRVHIHQHASGASTPPDLGGRDLNLSLVAD